jgi:hypothetical protein
MDGVRAMARDTADMLREGRFPAAPERDRCGRCAMRALCPAGQRALAEDEPSSALVEATDAAVPSAP